MFFSFLETIITNIDLSQPMVSTANETVNAAANSSGFMGSVNSLFASLNWQTPSWDLFIILFFVLSALIYGMSLGRQRIIVILISIYMSLAVANYAPVLENFLKDRGVGDFFLFKVTTFLGAFLFLFFFLSRSALLKTFGGGNHDGSWWQVMIFSILQIGLLISVTLSYLPANVTASLSDLTKQIFINDTAKFLWIIAPILAMIIIRAPKRRRNLGPIDEDYY
jgi:hypothetical protein